MKNEDGKSVGRVPVGLRPMTLTPEAAEQLERILGEPKQMPEVKKCIA